VSGADLVLEDVVVEYATGAERVRPVDGFSTTVHDGALALLLGPSGCGKTTLLSCLAGILRPTSGSVRHGDRAISELAGADLLDYRRHGVGIVFQAFNLIPSLTALENVMLPMRSAGVGRGEARQRATQLLTEVELVERMDFSPSRLSGGQQQRVAIARALALDPPLVLADEPTAHLDYVQVEVTLRILRRLAAPGRVVVVVTHDDRLLPIADQIVELVPHVAPNRSREPVVVELAAGEALFEQGDASDLIYRIDEGTLDVARRDVGTTEHAVVASIGAGEVVGEMGPLFGLPRSATVRASGPARLTGYSVEAFRDLVGNTSLDLLVRGGDTAGLGRG
jgi:putative ABC transport system ATP-binding protein